MLSGDPDTALTSVVVEQVARSSTQPISRDSLAFKKGLWIEIGDERRYFKDYRDFCGDLFPDPTMEDRATWLARQRAKKAAQRLAPPPTEDNTWRTCGFCLGRYKGKEGSPGYEAHLASTQHTQKRLAVESGQDPDAQAFFKFFQLPFPGPTVQ